MSGSKENGMAGHFGRQVRKERLAHGWSLDELSRRTGMNAAHLSRIENGRRPPTEAIAQACDTAFPERRGWFSDWYDESRTWAEVPPGFRSWAEVEEKAMTLHVWSPGIVHGLLQTEDYARALISVQPPVATEIARARLASRMERQRRVMRVTILLRHGSSLMSWRFTVLWGVPGSWLPRCDSYWRSRRCPCDADGHVGSGPPCQRQ